MAVETLPLQRPPKPSGGNVPVAHAALTLLTPVRPFWIPFLWFVMRSARYHTYFRDHSLQFKFIYYVRWAIFRSSPAARRSATRTCSSRATSTSRGASTSTRSPT